MARHGQQLLCAEHMGQGQAASLELLPTEESTPPRVFGSFARCNRQSPPGRETLPSFKPPSSSSV